MKGTRCLSFSIAKHLMMVAAVATLGCASGGMSNTWTDPSARGASLSTVAVVCVTKDPDLRRIAEDAVAWQLVGAHAVPSYRVLGEVDVERRDVMEAKLKELGFQGALVMRIVRVTQHTSPATSGGFTYFGSPSGPMYSPPYLEPDTEVHVVSNLYALQEGRLIWSGVSRNFDPASANAFMADLSRAVAKSIQKDRLVL
jgi:hypothetical protein